MKLPIEKIKTLENNSTLYCVDILVYRLNPDKKVEILSVLRSEQPAKGQWYPIGGRILKNENEMIAAKRKVKEELGINIEIKNKIGVYREIFDSGHFDGGENLDSLSIAFLAVLGNIENEIKIDNTIKDYCWFNPSDKKLSPYLKQLIFDSKISHDLTAPTQDEFIISGISKFDKLN